MRLSNLHQPILDFKGHGQAARDREFTTASSRARPSHHLPAHMGARKAWKPKLASLCAQAVDEFKGGATVLIISDRNISATQVADPALLALSAIHQHSGERGLRTTAGLVVETGSAREVHHFGVLAGDGAEAVHPTSPWTLAEMHKEMSGDMLRRQGHLQLREGRGQGPLQDHVQDGREHLHE